MTFLSITVSLMANYILKETKQPMMDIIDRINFSAQLNRVKYLLKQKKSDEINVKFKNDRRVFHFAASLLISDPRANCDSISSREGQRTSGKFVILSNDMNKLSLFTVSMEISVDEAYIPGITWIVFQSYCIPS